MGPTVVVVGVSRAEVASTLAQMLTTIALLTVVALGLSLASDAGAEPAAGVLAANGQITYYDGTSAIFAAVTLMRMRAELALTKVEARQRRMAQA